MKKSLALSSLAVVSSLIAAEPVIPSLSSGFEVAALEHPLSKISQQVQLKVQDVEKSYSAEKSSEKYISLYQKISEDTCSGIKNTYNYSNIFGK